MSVRSAVKSSFALGFFWPPAMISSEVTTGTPDFIIVASWRLNTAISLGVTRLPAPPNSGLGLGLTTVGVMHHAADTQRCVDEAHRVLRDGGQALIMQVAKTESFLCSLFSAP